MPPDAPVGGKGPASPQETSFRRRYSAKLTTGVAGLAVNFVNISLLPRALGPTGYGSFEFLSAFFQNMSGFWDAGTSTAFFNKLSRRNHDAGLVRFYVIYASLVAAVIASAVGAVKVLGLQGLVWPDQSWRYILLAAALGYLLWLSEVFRKVADAFGLTVSGEFAVLGLRSLGAVAVVGLFLSGWLNLTSVFVKELVLAGGIALGLCWLARRHWRRHLRAGVEHTSSVQLRAEFWVYCSPLLLYALVGVVAGIGDRWILQTFAGSVQQGFYGLAARLAAVSLIFSVAMTQLLQREFSRAHGKNDLETMRHLFRRYIPLLYTVTAYFAAFTCMQAPTLVWVMGGDTYEPAVPATMLMTLYPIHQTYGQLSGSIFYATEQTALYRNIGVAAMVVGLLVTWVVLSPGAYGGFGAGGTGLAAKMVVMQFVAVNVQLWFNLKYLRLSFPWFFAHQVMVAGGFLALAWGSVRLIDLIGLSRVPGFVASGVLYTVLVGALVLWRPQAAGLSRNDVRRLTARLRATVAR